MPIDFSIKNLIKDILLNKLINGPKNIESFNIKSVLDKNLSTFFTPFFLDRTAFALVINLGKSNWNSWSLSGV